MEQTHWHLIIVITIALSQNSSNVEGRAHFHKEHKGPSVYALSFHDPVSQSPAYSPVQSDTSEPGNSSSDCIFDVTSFGAIGDGSVDDTAAFRAAWKAACDIESGVLLAPSNYTFMITSTIFSGPCKPGLVFQVDGVLMPPNGPDWWPKSDSNREWLVFYRLDQMTFTGIGTIEGNGEQWWELPCKPHRGPNGSTLPGPCDSPTVSKSAQHSVLAFTQSIIEIFLSNNANGRQICIDWRGDNTEVILNGL